MKKPKIVYQHSSLTCPKAQSITEVEQLKLHWRNRKKKTKTKQIGLTAKLNSAGIRNANRMTIVVRSAAFEKKCRSRSRARLLSKYLPGRPAECKARRSSRRKKLLSGFLTSQTIESIFTLPNFFPVVFNSLTALMLVMPSSPRREGTQKTFPLSAAADHWKPSKSLFNPWHGFMPFQRAPRVIQRQRNFLLFFCCFVLELFRARTVAINWNVFARPNFSDSCVDGLFFRYLIASRSFAD